MYAVVIRDYDGEYCRELENHLPTEKDLQYWEEYYKINKGGDYPSFGTNYLATVVNVFEVAE